MGEEVTIWNKNWNIRNGDLKQYHDNKKNIMIPNGVKTIKEYAIENKEINSVLLPDSVKSIDSMAFANNHLTEVEFPANVDFISSKSFSGNQIKKIKIQSNVIIARDAFLENPLEIITISPNVQHVTWRLREKKLETVKVLELPNNINLSDIVNACPNIEKLYIDNLPKRSLRKFLRKCQLNDKQNLKSIFLKNKVGWIEKLLIQLITGCSNITFGYDEINDEKTNYPIEPILPENKKFTKDLEIQERIDKIYKTIQLFSEEEKKIIEENVTLLIEEYKKNLEELNPKFEIQNNSKIVLNPKDIPTLRKILLSDLDHIIVKLSTSSILNHFIQEITECKNCMQKEVLDAPIEIETNYDKVCFIRFVSQKLNVKSSEEQLKQLLDEFQKRASEEALHLFNKENNLTFESNIEIDFKRKITELYEKTKEYNRIYKNYQELMESLELKNDLKLAIDIRTAKEILNIFFISDKNRISEKLERILTNYKRKIIETVHFENIENVKESSKMEQEIRKELQPLLEEIYTLTPKMVCYHMLKEKIKSSLEFFSYEKEENLPKSAILETIKEIKESLKEEYINPEMKMEILNLLESKLQKWLEELTNHEYQILKKFPKREMSDNLYFELLVIKDLLTIKDSINNYCKKREEYLKYRNGIFEIEKNSTFENIEKEKDLILLKEDGAPIEDFNLENYKNYMKENYRSTKSIGYDKWKIEWETVVDKIDENFLDTIIKNTKTFIFLFLELFENNSLSAKEDVNDYFDTVIEIELKIKDLKCIASKIADFPYDVYFVFNPLHYGCIGDSLMVSRHLLEVVFEKLDIKFSSTTTNKERICWITVPKKVLNSLYLVNYQNISPQRKLEK